VNSMVASRNQMHVMSRAFGSTQNGSLPAYGATGEMESYLNGRRQVSMRGLGNAPKPNFAPTVRGEVMDHQEISTKFGWGATFIVKNASGYYVVQACKPGNSTCTTKGKYPNMDEAKAAAEKCAYNMRNSGKASGISGLNGYGSMGGVLGSAIESKLFLGSAVVLYIGAGLPGAEMVVKQVSKTLREPKTAVQNAMMFVGLSGMGYYLYEEARV